jgi:hypothetical protein
VTDAASDRLADYVVERLGEDLALAYFAAVRQHDAHERLTATGALYWRSDPAVWRKLDEVVRIDRREVVRLAAVAGLARRFGFDPPAPPTDLDRRRERARDRIIDAGFRRACVRRDLDAPPRKHRRTRLPA